MSIEKNEDGRRDGRRRLAGLLILCLSLAFVTSCATSRPNAEAAGLQEQAEKGDIAAQRTLGVMFDFGKSVKRDYVQAAKWYRMASDNGDALAQNNLASLYANGLGMPTNLTLAVELYRKSAEQEYALAQNSLGGHYYHGWGVPQDRNEAFRWFKRAAENRNFNAMHNLSNCYRLGVGTGSDLPEAYKWAELAAVMVQVNGSSKNIRGARQFLTALERTVPRTAALEGHQRAQEWLANHPIPAKEFLEGP
jgi:TPR repeat protein